MTASMSNYDRNSNSANPSRTAWAVIRWLTLYLWLVTAPLFALLTDTRSVGLGFAWDLAMALGYAGAAMLGIQFLLTARFRRATSPFGIDIVYYFHRYLAIAAVVLVLLHYLILLVDVPEALGSAWPQVAPGHMTAGRLSLVLFGVICLLSIFRRQLKLEYDIWRISHALLSVSAFGLAFYHIFGAGHYLDTPWKKALWAIYGAGWVVVILYVRLWRPLQLLRNPYRVVSVRGEPGDVWTLELEPKSGAVMQFLPGQFVWLTIGSSPFAMREHPFSIASSAEHPERILLSIKNLGDFTSTIKHVPPGATAYVDGPYGTFGIDLHPEAIAFVMIAGGIGIAPLLSMLRTMADREDRRPVLLFYGNRRLERASFRHEIERLQQLIPLQVVHVVEEPPDGWTGERGLLDGAVLARHLPKDCGDLVFFACGPVPMILSVERALSSLGVKSKNVHAELFDWV
jgi:predicted ferric reductase